MRRDHAIGARIRLMEHTPRFNGRALLLGTPLFVFLVVGHPGAAEVLENGISLTRISDRVIVLDCQNVKVTAIASDSGIVVVDTNRSPGVMRRLRGVIEEEFGRRDFAYLVNTHGDPDHSSGNQVFPSVPLIAHENYAAFVRHGAASRLRSDRNRRIGLEAARSRLEALDSATHEADSLRTKISDMESMRADPEADLAAKTPAIVFEDSLTLDLGDLTLEMRFCGSAHTNHDIVVYIPEEKLLLTGDLICAPRSPCFSVDAMADIPRLVRELDRFLRRAEGLETVVPGHGTILTRGELSSFCRAVSERYVEVRIERSAAWVMDQAIEAEGIEAALGRFPGAAPGNRGDLDWSEGEIGVLGIRLVRQGMAGDAERVLELALDVLPDSAYLYGCLGDACLENDDRDAAIVAYGKSLALAPSNRHAAELLKVLRGGE